MMTFHREGRSIMLGSMVIFLGLSALNYYFLASTIFGLFLFLEIGFFVMLYLIIQFSESQTGLAMLRMMTSFALPMERSW